MATKKITVADAAAKAKADLAKKKAEEEKQKKLAEIDAV